MRFSAIADESPSFMFMADKNIEVEFFNKTFLDFAGMSFEEAKGRAWVEVTHPDDFWQGG